MPTIEEPFPWDTLRRFTPDEVRVLPLARQCLPTDCSPNDFALAFESILKKRIALTVSKVAVQAELPSWPEFVSVPLALGSDREARAVVYLQNTLAKRLLRLIKEDAKNPAFEGTDIDAVVDKFDLATKMFVAQVAARTGEPWRRAAKLPDGGPFAFADIKAVFQEQSYTAVAAVRLTPSDPPLPAPFTRTALASYGDLPLSLPVVAAVCGATSDELALLEPGCGWAPGEQTWTLRRTEAGLWQGHAMLVSPAIEVGLEVQADDDGRGLRVRGLCATSSWNSAAYGDDPDSEAMHAVRVEIGQVTLGARAWASALTPGARLPAPKGTTVTLRIAGRAVARGQLRHTHSETGEPGELFVHITETVGGPSRR